MSKHLTQQAYDFNKTDSNSVLTINNRVIQAPINTDIYEYGYKKLNTISILFSI